MKKHIDFDYQHNLIAHLFYSWGWYGLPCYVDEAQETRKKSCGGKNF